MAEFQEVMKQWRRMCNKMREQGDWCQIDKCPLAGKCQLPSTTDIALVERIVMQWAAEHPEPQYPTWIEFFLTLGLSERDGEGYRLRVEELNKPMDPDIAQKLDVEPKEGA